MKKAYISVDMEGISAMVCPQQMRFQKMDEERREIATKEVNAVIEGCIKAGAEVIYINDSHPPSLNLIPEMLDVRAELIRGSVRLNGTLEQIDDSFDGVILVGLHAKSGTQNGVLNHTWSSSVYDFRVNGLSVGEIGINAFFAGEFNVPVIMVVGDEETAKEANNLLCKVETVITKKGLESYAARTIHPEVVRKKLKETAYKAATDYHLFKPLVSKRPIIIEIDFNKTVEAAICCLIPGVVRVSPRTVRYQADSYITVHKCFMAMTALANSLKDEAMGDVTY